MVKNDKHNEFVNRYNSYINTIDTYKYDYSFLKKQDAINFIKYILDNKYVMDNHVNFSHDRFIKEYDGGEVLLSKGCYEVSFYMDIEKGYDSGSFGEILTNEFLSKLKHVKGGTWVVGWHKLEPAIMMTDEEVEKHRIEDEKRIKSPEYAAYNKKHYSKAGLNRFKKMLTRTYKIRDKLFA